jgi:DNA-binding NarL/FixJ family response regulator
MTASPTLLILSADLMSSVRIADSAAALGYHTRVVEHADQLDGTAAPLAVIDFASPPIEPADAVARLRAANPTTRIIAVYRHTDPQQARAARAAGCDAVLNRAQFFSDIAGALDIMSG